MALLDPRTLRRNLRALARRDPRLADRLCRPVDSSHVREGPAGPELRAGRGWAPLGLGPERARALAAAPAAGSAPLALGVGLGEPVAALLARRDLPVVAAWDRDPWMLRLLLGRHDLREAIRRGRLRLLLAADLLSAVPWNGPVVEHPLVRLWADEERAWPAAGAPAPRVLLAAGELLVRDLGRALAARGWTVVPWEVRRHSLEELADAARTAEPDAIFAVNYRPGMAELARELGLRLVVWEIDPHLGGMGRPEVPTDHVHVFAYRRPAVEAFRRAGFVHVRFAHLATDPGRRRPVPGGPADVPVAFVGNSMAERAADFRAAFVGLAVRAGGLAPDAAAALLDAVLAAQRAEPRRYLVPEALDALAPGLRARAAAHGDLAGLAGELAAAAHRARAVAVLAPVGVHVWGDPGWGRLAAAGVRVRGYARHGDELSAIYAAAAINLDVGRFYQRDVVTMRVFDVLACGGFLLAEHTDELAGLFEPGVHLDTWRDTDELVDKARFYLARADLRRRIAEAGRARVLERHTVAHRLDAMLRASGIAPPAARYSRPPGRSSMIAASTTIAMPTT